MTAGIDKKKKVCDILDGLVEIHEDYSRSLTLSKRKPE